MMERKTQCEKRKVESQTAGIPLFRNEKEDRIIVMPSKLLLYCQKNCEHYSEELGDCLSNLLDEHLAQKRKSHE